MLGLPAAVAQASVGPMVLVAPVVLVEAILVLRVAASAAVLAMAP